MGVEISNEQKWNVGITCETLEIYYVPPDRDGILYTFREMSSVMSPKSDAYSSNKDIPKRDKRMSKDSRNDSELERLKD